MSWHPIQVASCFAAKFHRESGEPHGSDIHTRRGLRGAKRRRLHGTELPPPASPPPPPLALSRCLIHCSITLFPSDAHPCFHFTAPSLPRSLILSCVSVLGAQRMLNMCSGWGLGAADFIGATLCVPRRQV